MALENIAVSLMCLFLCDHINCIKIETDESSKNVSTAVSPRPVKEDQPSNLVPWYNMMHSFVDDMYVPGKIPLIILWIDGSMTKLKEGSSDSGEVFTHVCREGHRRVFQNARSAVFIIFLLIVTITLVISGWFTCGYRIIGLCGTRPSHLLDNNQAVAFRICMLFLMLGLIIGIIILIYFALINTIFANAAFSGLPMKQMDSNVDYIDQWVSNFSKKYAGNGTAKHFSPTNEDILKAVTDAYRGYYGYVFEKAGLHLLEYEVKVLAKYTYFAFQSYYQIIAAHSAFTQKASKIQKLKSSFTTNLYNFLNVCSNCDYYKPFDNKVHFHSLKMNATLAKFIYEVSLLKTDQLFGTHYEFISKRLQDILLQIPQNKSLYKELVSFLKNASDTYYAATFKQIRTAISNFVITFEHLTATLRLSSNMGAISSSHYARHAFTIIFCIALLVAITITLVALVLGCVLPPRPLSEELPYNKYRCRELPAFMMNVAAIIVFITIICILIFVMSIFIVGVPFEWGYCQFLTERYPNGLLVISKAFAAHNPKSSILGIFSSLLGRCLQGRGTLYEMLHLKEATDWNTTYAFLKKFNRTAEDIYHVPEFMSNKFPTQHAFLNFCDFYENAVTSDVQTAIYQLPDTTLNLKLSKNLVYKSHELPLEMRDLRDGSTENEQVKQLYENLVTIVAMDLLLNSLKHSYNMAHPWRFLSWHLRNVKDLYNKARAWFYSPERVSSTKSMFLKFAAAALNLLFKDVLKRDMPCAGIGACLDLYFYNFCRMFVDPWNATWLIFLFLLLLLFPLLLGLFVLILCYRKQNDRKLSDLQHVLKSCCGKKYEGDDIPPEPVQPKKKKEESEESDSDSSVAIIGFNHGCYIFCRTFTICSNFLVYLLLCKWKDRKKRAKRMNADPQKRRSISELPDNFFPAPVVVPLGCGPHLVGRCCCLKLEQWKKSDLEEDAKRKERKKKKKMLRKQKKGQEAQELLPKEGKGESLRERLLNEAEEERQPPILSGEPDVSESEVTEVVRRGSREEVTTRESSGAKKALSSKQKSEAKSQQSSQRGSDEKISEVKGQRSSQRGSDEKISEARSRRSSQQGSDEKISEARSRRSSQRGSDERKSEVEGQRSSQRGSDERKSEAKSRRSSQRGSDEKKSEARSRRSSQRGSEDEES